MQKLTVNLGFSEFPPPYTCSGGNRSPALALKGVQCASLAVVAVNPFEPCCSFAAWLIWNLEPVEVIPEGIPPLPVVTTPVRGIQGKNDYGKIGYAAPCPSGGRIIRYTFKVYGLDRALDLPAGSSKDIFYTALRGHVLQYGDTFAMARG
ncbi:MAG: YbhB/YbcL family Raf kinase inhibitor-like protein [Methanomicrobiales archaeon]|nr:YbhB/YbcL family Raf kinase inhibitor-like protein [Methanomicrobiales archaeon]